MTVGALVMAGGDGARMARSTGHGLPKPLVPVRGVSLLERNLGALVGAGLREVWVACRDEQHAIRAEVAGFADRVRPRGVAVRTLIEAQPLGTIGAAGLLRGQVDALVSVNADNLCALDLQELLAHHADTGADLTLAAHEHVVRIPYGELVLDADRVAAYREKPVHATWVCSATCVLGPRALAALDGRTGLPELTARLVERGGDVRAFEHAAPWIDVNDAGDVARAAALLAAHPGEGGLECWTSSPDVAVVGAIVRDGDRLLLERRRRGAAAGLWDTPGGKIEPREAPAAALVRELREELGLDVGDPGPEVARFDAVESDGRIVRHHVFALRAAAAHVRACEGQTLAWFELGALPGDRARVVSRSLTWID